MQKTQYPILIEGLVKNFGKTTAVDQLNLQVRPGTVHGFLGPNGAGKSTTIRCLLGMLRADAGQLLLGGHDPQQDPAAATASAAYVPGDVALWPQLTGAQTLATLARLRPSGDDPQRRAELIERFQLDPSKKMRAYSKGNRQKVALIAALAANTDVLVLDEPTSGLDPLMERVFADSMKEAAARGTSVLLSSHILSEVQGLADDITIIRDGRVVESGPLAELSYLRGFRVCAILPGGRRFETNVDAQQQPVILRRLIDQHATDIVCAPASLEDIFLAHYAGDGCAELGVAELGVAEGASGGASSGVAEGVVGGVAKAETIMSQPETGQEPEVKTPQSPSSSAPKTQENSTFPRRSHK